MTRNDRLFLIGLTMIILGAVFWTHSADVAGPVIAGVGAVFAGTTY